MIYDHEPFMLSIQFRIRREILDNDFYRFYKKDQKNIRSTMC